MRKTILTLAVLTLATGALAQDTRITGFVDAAYFYDTHAKNGEFGLDQVEVDIEHRASEKTLVRADLEWIKDSEDYAAQVEQAFMTYTVRCGWAFTFGKFNAPIGFELLDPHEMYQYSHSLVFDYASPTNLTGLKLAREFGRGFDIVAHVTNGWDRATADRNVTWGGRLGYAAGGFAGGLAAISGKEEMPPEVEGDPAIPFARTVLDADLSYATGPLRFGADLNRGQVDLPAGGEAEWLALMLMTHVDFNDWAGLTLRLDHFDDEDGFVFGDVDGEFQQRRTFTIAPTFVLDDGFGALVELRIDTSDQDAFLDADGEPTDTTTSLAFEMTYSW